MRHILIAALAWLVLGTPVKAQQACLSADILAERLASEYGEQKTGSGLMTETQALEIWASPETGTWTIFLVTPAGIACIISTGRYWQDWAERPAPDGDPM